jgi:predicted oxidoreductase
MEMIQIGNTPLKASRIGYGCMRLSEDRSEAMDSVKAALDNGINFFDHADIYGGGDREAMFSHIWDEIPGLRENVIIQSKCGIRRAGEPDPKAPTRYDFSYAHILRSVEGSLKRLKTDYLDILLLHRPDVLMEPAEIARAFDELSQTGKVRHFGVSNHTGAQIELLSQWLEQPIVVNQLLVNVLSSQLLEIGINLTRRDMIRKIRGDGTLEYCWLNDVTIQAWSPLATGAVSGDLPDDAEDHVAETAALVTELAEAKDVSQEAIVIGWLLRHPVGIQPIIGTTTPSRISGSCGAVDVDLSREEWYRLFIAGRGETLP